MKTRHSGRASPTVRSAPLPQTPIPPPTSAVAGRPRHPGGRPPKFAEPRRPVTVTLPERTLAQLATIHPDRARAIAQAAATVAAPTATPAPSVELVRVASGVGLIVIGPCRPLRRIPWLQLPAIAPGRHLLALSSGTAIDSLEIAIRDILDDDTAATPAERDQLNRLLELMRGLRRGHKVSKTEILLVSLPN